jgi:hypothetical protein
MFITQLEHARSARCAQDRGWVTASAETPHAPPFHLRSALGNPNRDRVNGTKIPSMAGPFSLAYSIRTSDCYSRRMLASSVNSLPMNPMGSQARRSLILKQQVID